MIPDREKRFCTCGYSVYGTELERRNAFAAHRVSDEHKKRVETAALHWVVDGLVEADIERRLSE